jgi:hypothetical protein
MKTENEQQTIRPLILILDEDAKVCFDAQHATVEEKIT